MVRASNFNTNKMNVIKIKQVKKYVRQQRKTIEIGKIFMFLPFKTMVIITNCSFFTHMNVQEFKTKIHLIKFEIKFQF